MLSSLRIKNRPNDQRPTSFRAYVDLKLLGTEPTMGKEELDTGGANFELTPNLLPGEVEIASVENVLKYSTFSELKTGISGVLFCTNFKLSFVTAQQNPYSLHHQNFLLGENDICLVNIDSIYQVTNGRRKKLLPGSNQLYAIEIIEVHCKDFRVMTFSFKFSPANKDRVLINSILHHAFAPKVNLLFAFDYLNHATPGNNLFNSRNCVTFTKQSDWSKEMKRTGCKTGWRITLANETFGISNCLPEAFVIPAVLLDKDLFNAAPSFSGHRVLTWSWGNSKGQSLTRMASLDINILDDQQLNKLHGAVEQVNSEKLKPLVLDLDEECCKTRDIQTSFLKLKEIIMPSSSLEFWEQDSMVYSILESSRWLEFISKCLKATKKCCLELERGSASIIIMEQEGSDLNCLVASLIQLVLDPFFRTQDGFESLIQKEWVAMSHPFPKRLGHIRDVEEEEAPVFLLFLDCVWQLTQQFPSSFEFSETYLTTVWDSTHVSIFETFLFNTVHQKKDLLKNQFSLPRVWDWSTQYSQQDTVLFRNPLYYLKNTVRSVTEVHQVRPQSLGAKAALSSLESQTSLKDFISLNEDLMEFDDSIVSLNLWHQMYFRWIPLCNIVGGGAPIIYLQNLALSEDIKFLANTYKSLASKQAQNKAKLRHRRSVSDEFCITVENDTRRIHQKNTLITSAFPFSPIGPSEWRKFNVPSSSYLCVSYGGIEEEQDD